MIKTFNKAKVQLMMVGEGHETGIARTFNNMIETPSDDQIKSLGEVLETISNDKFDCAIVTASHKISK